MSGKGSSRRGSDPESRRKFEEGYARAFGKKPAAKRKRPTKLKPYPSWACGACAAAVRGKCPRIGATYHERACEVCGKVTWVTEPRDYGFPDWPGHETRVQYLARWLKTLPPEDRAFYDCLRRMADEWKTVDPNR